MSQIIVCTAYVTSSDQLYSAQAEATRPGAEPTKFCCPFDDDKECELPKCFCFKALHSPVVVYVSGF